MSKDSASSAAEETIEVDLREPWLAALLAWFWPGAGHIYQRRYAKGVLFMVCILSTYFYGLAIGGGHVVYASWKKEDRRWQYGCQFLVGAPALPALVQSVSVEPLFGGFMAPPKDLKPDGRDELAQWHEQFAFDFEFGTLFTVIAGLLNVLAIYDAYGGPATAIPDSDKDKPPPDKRKKKSTA